MTKINAVNQIVKAFQATQNNIKSKKTTSITIKNDSFQRSISKSDLYTNKEVINKIKALKGSALDNINKIKDIFMTELGYPKGLIHPKLKEMQYSAGFNFINGGFFIQKQLINEIKKEELAGIIRHELEHFLQGAKLYKAIGAENYQKIFGLCALKEKSVLYDPELLFNKTFWDKTLKYTSIKNFDTEKYIKALNHKVKTNNEISIGTYNYFKRDYDYITNPLEIDAHKIQHKVNNSLNAPKALTKEYIIPIFEQADNALKEKLKSNPILLSNRDILFDSLFTKAIILSNKKLSQLEESINNSTNKNKTTIDLFHKILTDQKKYLCGDDTVAPDTSYIKYVFEHMENILENIKDSDIHLAFLKRIESLKGNKEKNIKHLLSQNIDDYLKYLDSKNLPTPKTRFYLLLDKIHAENEISKKIPFDIKNIKIEENTKNQLKPLLNEILQANNLPKTEENRGKVLHSFLKKTAID